MRQHVGSSRSPSLWSPSSTSLSSSIIISVTVVVRLSLNAPMVLNYLDMAATTYKKYYKITCDSFSSRLHNILFFLHTNERYHTDGQFHFSVLREYPRYTQRIRRTRLRENRLCPRLRGVIVPRERDVPTASWSSLRSRAFLKYVIIERLYIARYIRNRSARGIGRTHLRWGLWDAHRC